MATSVAVHVGGLGGASKVSGGSGCGQIRQAVAVRSQAQIDTSAMPAQAAGRGGFPGWAIALLIVGGVLLLGSVATVLLLFVFR